MAQRKQFTDAVNALKMNKGAIDEPAPSYDDLVLQHREAYRTPCPWVEHGEEPNIYHRNGDQKGPAFLPWHRQQLMVLEKALQQVSGDATLGVPYWNWLKDSSKSDPAAAPLWSADEGIGGTGRSSDFVVADGPFAHWPLKYADLGEEYLERNLGGALAKPGNAADFAAAFAETTYDEPPTPPTPSVASATTWRASTGSPTTSDAATPRPPRAPGPSTRSSCTQPPMPSSASR